MTSDTTKDPTDELLLSSSKGNLEAFSELFGRYSEKLYNYAYYLTLSREDAEDATSETFVKVYEAIQGRDLTSFNLQAYLYATARNLCFKSIQRRKREGLTMEEASELPELDAASDPQLVSLIGEQRISVRSVADALTEEQQTALLLKEIEGLPYDTIAQVLGSNTNAVGALLSRARLKFREVYRMAQVQTDNIPDECVSLLPALSRYIDSEASPEEIRSVQEHIGNCPICAENLASMQEASATYRSLIPILPLASFKVWSAAKGSILTAKAASVSHAAATSASTSAAPAAGAAAATTAAATTAATTAAVTTGMALTTKIVVIVAAVLVAGGIGTGTFFTLNATVFAQKTIPALIGLKQADAEKKISDAGLKSSVAFAHPDWPRTEHEVVTTQDPAKDTKLNSGKTVTITLEDKDFAAAHTSAEAQIGTANQKLAQCQSDKIDTSDLAPLISSAQAKHDNAKTVADLVGPTDSATFYSNQVIQQCDARIIAWQKEQEREKQIAADRAKVVGTYLMPVGGDTGGYITFSPDGTFKCHWVPFAGLIDGGYGTDDVRGTYKVNGNKVVLSIERSLQSDGTWKTITDYQEEMDIGDGWVSFVQRQSTGPLYLHKQ